VAEQFVFLDGFHSSFTVLPEAYHTAWPEQL
jgi:hypothetical protein